MDNSKDGLPNYLLMLLDDEDDSSIRIADFGQELHEIWKGIENKNDIFKSRITLKRNIYRYIDGSRAIPISVLYKIMAISHRNDRQKLDDTWNSIFRRAKYFKTESSRSKIVKLPKDLTFELSYLVGALRDGCLVTYSKNRNHFGVLVTQESCPEWLKVVIIPIFQKLFQIEPKLRKEIQVYNKAIFKFFEKVFEHPPGNQSEWKTPRLIRESSLNVKLGYIQGFFDADGVISTTDNKLGFVQKNKESLEFIKKTLNTIGVKSGSLLKDRTIWRFWIAEKNSVVNFIEKIGSQHPNKKIKLEQMLTRLCHSRS